MCTRIRSIIGLVLISVIFGWSASYAAASEADNSGTAPVKPVVQKKETATQVVVDDIATVHVVTVSLYGISRYEVVAMFNHLLEKISITTGVEQLETVYAPGRPMRCRAIWQVTATGQDSFGLESELFTVIRDLNPEGENELFADLLFVPQADDIKLLKQIRPSQAKEDTLVLVSPGLRGVAVTGSGKSPMRLNSGFD